MRQVLVGILVTLVVILGLAAIIPDHKTATQLACEDAWDRMQSFTRCVATAGCFYDAEMWYKAKKAHSFHDSHCDTPVTFIPKQPEEAVETSMDSRYAST